MSRARTLADYGNGIDTASIISGTLADARIPSLAASKITSGTFATARIADDAVTLDKMASGVDGKIITYDASGNPSAVGPGTDGQVLTSTGADSPPAFEAVSSNSRLVLIKTETAPTATSWDIENCFSSSYDAHIVSITDLGCSTSQSLYMRFIKTDDSVDSTSNYKWVLMGMRMSGDTYSNTSGASEDDKFELGRGLDASTGYGFSTNIQITGAMSTGFTASYTGTVTYANPTFGQIAATIGGSHNSYATQFDGIQLYLGADNFSGGRVSVFGLKYS